MGQVVVDLSISLDGFIARPHPLGLQGAEQLHEWLFNGDQVSTINEMFKLSSSSRDVFDESVKSTGAIIVGKRWFETVDGWGGNPPLPVPYFVLTHNVPEKWSGPGSRFTFVTDGLESALEKARAAAGDKNISVGGANIAQQYLKAGLLDEILVHLVPILLGDGVRLFDQLDPTPIELESTQVVESPGVTHLRFRVVK